MTVDLGFLNAGRIGEALFSCGPVLGLSRSVPIRVSEHLSQSTSHRGNSALCFVAHEIGTLTTFPFVFGIISLARSAALIGAALILPTPDAVHRQAIPVSLHKIIQWEVVETMCALFDFGSLGRIVSVSSSSID
jgi:hypothetical protein